MKGLRVGSLVRVDIFMPCNLCGERATTGVAIGENFNRLCDAHLNELIEQANAWTNKLAAKRRQSAS